MAADVPIFAFDPLVRKLVNAANSAGLLNELILRRLKTKGECTHGYLRTIWIEFRYADYLMRLKSTSA